MPTLQITAWMVVAVSLPLLLGFLIIILWHDSKREANLFFAAYVFTTLVWASSTLVTFSLFMLEVGGTLLPIALAFMEVGFVCASITAYILTTALVNVLNLRFRLIALASVLIPVIYQVVTLRATTSPVEPNFADLSSYRFQNLAILLYLSFTITTFYLLWRYRARFQSVGLQWGLAIFAVGQLISVLNPVLDTFALSVILGAVGALIIGAAMLRQEIILPLKGRLSQIEAMHGMSLAITSQLALETVIRQIAIEAKNLLQADGVVIFLKGDDKALRVHTAQGLLSEFEGYLAVPSGVAWRVFNTLQSLQMHNYITDWAGEAELPYAKETFGAVVGVPLIYGQECLGVLMVITGRHGRTFSGDDLYLLELFGAQAAVAIAHSQLFSSQRQLTEQIESARNQLETLLTSTQNPVVAVDRQLQLIFANRAAEEVFPSILEGKLPYLVFPKSYRTVLGHIQEFGLHLYEVVWNERAYQCALTPIRHETQISGWVAVLNDVTQLKELDRLKSEMVRMTSHDLKNPLQAALSHFDLLHDILQDHPDPDIPHSMESLEKQLNRMVRIINGVLDMERLRTGGYVNQPCYPDQMLQQASQEFLELAKSRGITLQWYPPQVPLSPFLGDPGQFERALSNLIENAIKFTPDGGKVLVSVAEQAGQIVFKVTDNGIGIPSEAQQHVFESFFRANQRGAEHISGSGLGLNLVKTVVERHHGKVWLESESQMGTTFYISIPVAPDAMIAQ